MDNIVKSIDECNNSDVNGEILQYLNSTKLEQCVTVIKSVFTTEVNNMDNMVESVVEVGVYTRESRCICNSQSRMMENENQNDRNP